MFFMSKVLLMKQQFVITHTIRHTEIRVLLYSSFTNTLSVKTSRQKKKTSYFRKNMMCLNVSLLRICQYFAVFCKTDYRQGITICCFLSDI
jgi:hypothetical protein